MQMGRLLIDDDSLVSSLKALWMLQTPSQKTLQQVLLKVVNSQIGIFISIPFPKKMHEITFCQQSNLMAKKLHGQ